KQPAVLGRKVIVFGSMKSVSKGWPGSEMFTRRTATVTISAPEAATAAAFCSKLLYLPVPTMSRETKLLPATVQLSFASPVGAAIRLSAFTLTDSFVGRGDSRYNKDGGR